MNTQEPEPGDKSFTPKGKPLVSSRKKVLLFLICLFFCFGLIWQIGSVISEFFDFYSLFPLKTYTGQSFSLGYPQNWKVSGSRDDISLDPRSSLVSLPEPEDYNFNGMYLVAQPATSSSALGAEAEQQRAWEQRIPEFKSATMPQTVTIGGTSWVQLAATYKLVFKDVSPLPIEEVALSTVHRTKDGSYMSFLIVFSTTPTIFDRMYQQVLQRIFHSFVFR